MNWFYCLLLLLPNFCLSQKISGTVVDANNNAPVPFATIKVLHSTRGEITTTKGEFQIFIEPADTILISSVGYQTKILTWKTMSATVYLVPAPKMLEQVTIRPTIPIRTIILGNGKDLIHQVINCRFTENGPQDICWPWGPSGLKEEFAEKIGLDSSRLYRLLKVYVPVRKNNPYGPLLLRIYEEDSISGMPGEELFLKLVNVERKLIYKNKVVIDVSAENIYIGGRNFFISMSWPPGQTGRTNFTALAFFAHGKDNTYARNLLSEAYNWHPFGLMKNQNGQTKQINSAYAVEIEERAYK